jgi:uncharacterized membrane protein
MALNVARFFLLVLLSLFAGTLFGTLVGYNPASLSALAFVEQQQNAIRSFIPILPIMGGLCVVLTVGLAFRLRSDRRVCYLHIVAAILMVAAALVTRFGAQPINEIVMTLSAEAPAANWLQLRDDWRHWHIVRSVAGISALAVTVIAILASKGAPADTA